MAHSPPGPAEIDFAEAVIRHSRVVYKLVNLG